MACTTLLLLNACKTAQIPNVQFIASLGPNGAEVFDLFDSTESTLTLNEFAAQWNDLSNKEGPLVCMRTQDFSQIKADLEQLCSWIASGCTEQQQQAMTQFMTDINALPGN